jgi:hypothetical protein
MVSAPEGLVNRGIITESSLIALTDHYTQTFDEFEQKNASTQSGVEAGDPWFRDQAVINEIDMHSGYMSVGVQAVEGPGPKTAETCPLVPTPLIAQTPSFGYPTIHLRV